MDDVVPVGTAVPNLTMKPLEDGAMALSGILLLEVASPSGKAEWVLRTLGDVGSVPLIGALTVMLDHERSEYANSWVSDEDER